MTDELKVPGNGKVAQKVYVEGDAENSFQFRAEGLPNTYEGGYDDLNFFYFNVAAGEYFDELPQWGTRARDIELRNFIFNGPTVGRAILYGQVAQVKNMPYTIVSEDELIQQRYRYMLDHIGFGRGFQSEIQKIAIDYLTQDNGFFVELIPRKGRLFNTSPIEGMGKALVAGVIMKEDIASFAHLDSALCFRTYNPEYPVVYYNPYGGQRVLLHWTRVVYQAQFEQPVELARGRGHCALARAYPALRLIQDVDIYNHEKLTGNAPEIFYVSGMSITDLKKQLTAASEIRRDKGFARFKEPIIVGPPGVIPNAPPATVNKLGLRDVPDGFSLEEFMRIAVSEAAMAFGETPRGIGWPGMSTGETKADAEVSERGSTRKGHEDFLRTWEDVMNRRVMTRGATFKFDENSDTEDMTRAEIAKVNADVAQLLVSVGIITPVEARDLLAEAGTLSPRMLEEAPVITSDESPESATEKK